MSQLDWKAEYACTTGMQAFIYGFPYIYNAQLRHDWVTSKRDPDVVPYAAVDYFWHAARLIDASYRDGGCPNNDTLYSVAWLDLSKEPVILSHPDMADRYFTFELMGFTSDTYGYVGQRSTGSKAGDFAICGPGWQGSCPPACGIIQGCADTVDPDHGPGPGRRACDVPAARALQEQFRPTPPSMWGKRGAAAPARRDDTRPSKLAKTRSGRGSRSTRCPAENPPPAHHAVVLDQFARIGIRPGLNVDAQPDAVKQGLTRAAMTGMGLLRQQFLSGDWATMVNGWRCPPQHRPLRRRLPAAGRRPVHGRHHRQRPGGVGLPGELQRRRRHHPGARRPLRAAFQRWQPAPHRRILVPGRLHHKGHEPDPERR